MCPTQRKYVTTPPTNIACIHLKGGVGAAHREWLARRRGRPAGEVTVGGRGSSKWLMPVINKLS
eukprot:5944810-Prymnesium_polylepis.1